MPMLVKLGAITSCNMGMTPSALMVMPIGNTMAQGTPVANIMAFEPLVNILPFAMCKSMENPEVIAATITAEGVLTPMPCIPLTTSPWFPGSPTVLIGGSPALNSSDKCVCDWGGEISIDEAMTIGIEVSSG